MVILRAQYHSMTIHTSFIAVYKPVICTLFDFEREKLEMMGMCNLHISVREIKSKAYTIANSHQMPPAHEAIVRVSRRGPAHKP